MNATDNQSSIIERTKEICEEFDSRVAVVGLPFARLELAKALAQSEDALRAAVSERDAAIARAVKDAVNRCAKIAREESLHEPLVSDEWDKQSLDHYERVAFTHADRISDAILASVDDANNKFSIIEFERDEWRSMYIKNLHSRDKHPANHHGVCAICLQRLDYLDNEIAREAAAIRARGEAKE